MALTKCKECGKEMSTKADACPHCGAKRGSVTGKFWTGIKILVALVVGLVVYQCTQLLNRDHDSSPKAVGSSPAPAVASSAPPARSRLCSANDFTISGTKARREQQFMTITGTVTNTNSVDCGVQLKATAYDGQGAVVDTGNFWPASVRNIGAGAKEPFQWMLRFDPAAKSFEVVVIDAKQWNAR